MSLSDSIVSHLVQKVTAIAQRNYLQSADALTALQAPEFEKFLSSINLGIALYSSYGHFFYVSKSFSTTLGYPIETVYGKGPAPLQQITVPYDRPLVAQLVAQTEETLRKMNSSVSYPRISFDYHIVSGPGAIKRVYQHLMPNAIVHNNNFYTLLILHDFTGFKSSPVLNYRLSFLTMDEKFVTLSEGTVAPPCPYLFTKSEKEIVKQLAGGKSMATIANERHIHLETLKKHRNNILKKTGNNNMLALLAEGLKNGWLAK
jgi:DNA-binding CsgD family transcriptional regulator